MALKEKFHGALVYFGLAEEAPLTETHELPQESNRSARSSRSDVRRLPQRRGRDDFDDIFAEDSASPGAT